ncbi:MAG: amino acid ABC transporter permease [Candidatus Micrarchaeia archaeon]|jgi:polar amino acid transport system permease protein
MVGYSWNFNVVLAYKEAIFSGAVTTLELAFLTIIIGSVLGLLLCLMRLSGNRPLSLASAAFTEIFRDLPLLVVLIWMFYAIPSLFDIRMSAFDTAALGLSLNLAAFASDIFRAGMQAIPRGQREASLALGLSEWQALREVVLPQAAAVVLPPLTGRYIETIKLTSLASVIAVNELLHVGGNIIALTYRPLEVYTVVALVYWLMIAPLVLLLGRMGVEKWRT